MSTNSNKKSPLRTIIICLLGFISIFLSLDAMRNDTSVIDTRPDTSEEDIYDEDVTDEDKDDKDNHDKKVSEEYEDVPYPPISPKFGYCYNQLDKAQQQFYLAIHQALSEGKDSVKFKCEGINDYTDYKDFIDKIYYAIMIDYPEYYWFHDFEFVRDSDETVTLHLLNFDFWKYDLSKKKHYKNIMKQVYEITAEAEKYKTDFEKALYVHDYIISNTAYAYDELAEREKTVHDMKYDTIGTVYGCLTEKLCVCGGYAQTYSLIMNALNIETVFVYGDATGGRHAWNCIKLDGDWYYVDTTWDDITMNNSEGKTFYEEDSRYDYCFITSAEMSLDHTPDEDLIDFPDATSTKDNYFVKKGYYLTSADFDEIDRITNEQYSNKQSLLSIKFSDLKTLEETEDLLCKQNKLYLLKCTKSGEQFSYVFDKKLKEFTIFLGYSSD